MELEKFISESLTAIVKGVSSAQAQIDGTGAVINPAITGAAVERTMRGAKREVHHVEFDIAVTSETGKEGGAKIKVLEVGIGGEVTMRDSRVSRVQFTVGLALPTQGPEKTDAPPRQEQALL